MDRPGWNRLQHAVDAGEVSTIVVWRIDRLGQDGKGLDGPVRVLTREESQPCQYQGWLRPIDPSRRLLAHVLASVAQFETEIRAERILAGQAAARAAGKVWGGGKAGRRVTLTVEKEKAIKQLSREGKGISEIARVVELSRPTVYKALR